MVDSPHILYCHCKYADVISAETKQEVLRYLTQLGVSFHAVPDLCEMAARCDPVLKSISEQEKVIIVACFPRAVKALFRAADAPLNRDDIIILNMRTESVKTIVEAVSTTEKGTVWP